MKKPKMFICVGAQKAGTTWLNQYLTIQNELCFNYNGVKELHLWNCFYDKKKSAHHRNIIEQLKRQIFREKHNNKFDSETEKQLIKFKELYQFTLNPNNFLNKALIECKKREIPLCDFTPNYSIMSSADFEGMKNYIEKNFELKILFLMRDPINRIYSWLKHQKRMNYEQSNNIHKSWAVKDPTNNEPKPWEVYDPYFYRNVVDDCLKKKEFKKTFYYTGSNYPKIVDNLYKTFNKNQIKILYYEKLFTEETIISLCDFLDIDYKVTEFNRFANNDKNNINISLRERTLLLKKTRDIYKEMYFRYRDIPEEWSSFN